MFGIANQLLACIALCVGTSLIINSGRAKYAWVTILPASFLATNTLFGGWIQLGIFWQQTKVPATEVIGWVDLICTAAMMLLVSLIIIDSVYRWKNRIFTPKEPSMEYAGD
jgi:carbon starvation protein